MQHHDVYKENHKKNITNGVVVSLLAIFLVAAVLVGVGWMGWLPGSSATLAAGPQALTSQTNGPVDSQDAMQKIGAEDELLANLYDRVLPSIVNIVVMKNTPQLGRSPFPGMPQLPDQPQGGEGSGFIFDNEGRIVTNNHVIEDADQITVVFHNGFWADAELVAADPQADLAVIQVTPPEGYDWQPLTLAAPHTLRVGYSVLAIGSPFGNEGTLTTGIVSALGRSFPVSADPQVRYSLPEVIQTDAAINPGNSGGPLLNIKGEVVGVNFAINSPVRASSGIGFAIPVSVVSRVIPALIENGAYAYSYLGISGSSLTPDVAREFDLPNNLVGAWVAEVMRGGPAGEGGVQAEDIITAINDTAVRNFDDLVAYLVTATTPGQMVDLTVLRDGEQVVLSVELGERPSNPTAISQTDEATIGIAEAMDIATNAVEEGNLLGEIDNTNARRSTQDGNPVWIVDLTSGSKNARVIIDAVSGDVLELTTQ